MQNIVYNNTLSHTETKLSVKTCEDLKSLSLEKMKKLLGEGKGETIYNQIRGQGDVELQGVFKCLVSQLSHYGINWYKQVLKTDIRIGLIRRQFQQK